MNKYIIELIGNYFYRGKTQILKNIDWKIKKGEHWVVVGPNGSGKTTLLKIVSGNLWPSKGKVKVLGKEFGKADLRELRKKIGWVSSYLTEKIPENESILDIIISGKYASFGIYEKIANKDKEQAEKLLEFMDCSYIKERNFKIISQGEKQKVLIARSLMAKPLILILDEPCSGLDMKARESVLNTVSKICKQNESTIIYVTHHFEEIVPEINNVFMIKNGQSIKQGKSKTILTSTNIENLFK